MAKRLRVFAGPNGSGKSTIIRDVSEKVDLGVYVNADELEDSLRRHRVLDVSKYGVSVTERTFKEAYVGSPLSGRSAVGPDDFTIREDRIEWKGNDHMDSYFSAFVSDYLRYGMLDQVEKITMETVMSSTVKFDFFRTAAEKGYRIYLYYIATKSPEINVARVEARVAKGGHDVPVNKIHSRYARSLNNLFEAVTLCHRAYFFDNSGDRYIYLAEYDGERSELKVMQERVPKWFDDALLSKFG